MTGQGFLDRKQALSQGFRQDRVPRPALHKLLDRLLKKNFMFKHDGQFHEGWKQLLLLIEPCDKETGIVATSKMVVEQG